MKVLMKKFLAVGLSAVLLLSIIFMNIDMQYAEIVMAEDSDNKFLSNYYYANLVTTVDGIEQEYTLAKKFYQALEEMNQNGDFKDGVIEYDIVSKGIVTSGQLKAWVEDGNLEIPKAFGAARDSFMMDHPELFYIDVYKIMISAGRVNGKYIGLLDCGREDNIYRDNAFVSENEVNEAITAFEAAVKEYAEHARTKVNTISALYKEDAALAIAVCNEIAGNVKYDFNAYNDYIQNGENASTVSSLTHTAYGALVNKKAVCSGFSAAYKAIMDYLGIPCITVSGYSKGKNSNGYDTEGNVGHAWNYVKLQTASKNDSAKSDGVQSYEWFAFDVTWNSVCKGNPKYTVMDAVSGTKEHISSSVISSSGYSLKYPVLSMLNYAKAIDPDMTDIEVCIDGFKYSSVYQPFENTFDVSAYVSYNGKNASELLAQEGLRLVRRIYYMYDGQKQWSDWSDLANYSKYESSGVVDMDEKTYVYINNNIQYEQYAVIKNLDPDKDAVLKHSQTGEILIRWEKLYYSNAETVDEHIVFMSDIFENSVYGTYTPAPYINTEKTTPYIGGDYGISDSMSESPDSNIMADSKAIEFKIVYDEPLHILDNTKDIEATFTPACDNARKYAAFVPFDDGKYVHLIADENGVMNTLHFKFKPSLMYEHNRKSYIFMFENVGSAKIVEKKDKSGTLYKTTSDKIPNYAYYVFSRSYIACPCVFGDGRLWVDCCAQPTLINNSDLSAAGFVDENGESTFSENLRSQMMLVVSEVPVSTTDTILNEVDSDNSISVKKEDIKASQTYDIDLQICGKYAKIPDGSYVKIALGFPEGYGPEDEGVTFKIFHRKHINQNGKDEYIVEEVPCVVTKFGIVAAVTSFSPYMVVVVDADKVTDKTVYASIDGKGGKLSKEDGKIRTLKSGESYTYTIVPDSGYQIFSITLNGKDVTGKIIDGKLTVSYETLENNNEIEIKYIKNGAVKHVLENNIVVPVKVVADGDTVTRVSEVIEPPADLQIVETSPEPSTPTQTPKMTPTPTQTSTSTPTPTLTPTQQTSTSEQTQMPIPTATENNSSVPTSSAGENNPPTSDKSRSVLLVVFLMVGIFAIIVVIPFAISIKKRRG